MAAGPYLPIPVGPIAPNELISSLTNVITQVNSNAGETIYGRLRRLYAQTQRNGHPHVIDPATTFPQLASALNANYNPTITFPSYTNAAAAIAAGYSTQYNFTPGDPKFYPTGGTPFLHTGYGYVYTSVTDYSGLSSLGIYRSAIGARQVFYARASKVLIQVPTFAQYRILVNDRYLNLALQTQGNTYPFVLLDFTSAGGRLKRKITVEIGGNAQLPPAVFVQPQDELTDVPTADRTRMIVLGDSTAAGTGTLTSFDAWPVVMADALGVSDVWMAAIGGTGYVASTSTGIHLPNNLPGRMTDAFSYSPDLVMMAMNVNDVNNANSGQTNYNAIQPSILNCYNQLRTVLPNVPLFIEGVMSYTAMTSANLIAYENLLNSWVQSLQSAGDSNVFFLPLLTAAPPFQTGAGFVGNNTNDGNGQTIIAATLNTAAINNGGSGYATGDTFTINPSVASPQDALAFLTVSAQTSGVVTAITKNLGGTYSRGAPPATAAPTTAVTGSGTGLLLNCNMISQNPHPGAYGYQQYGERFADAIISAIAGKA